MKTLPNKISEEEREYILSNLDEGGKNIWSLDKNIRQAIGYDPYKRIFLIADEYFLPSKDEHTNMKMFRKALAQYLLGVVKINPNFSIRKIILNIEYYVFVISTREYMAPKEFATKMPHRKIGGSNKILRR